MDVGKIAGLVNNQTIGMKNMGWKCQPEQSDVLSSALQKEDVCFTVQISQEGYQRLEQTQKETDEDTLAPQTAEQTACVEESPDEEEREDSRTRFLKFLDQIEMTIQKARPKATKDTDDEKVAALEQLRQLKENQAEEYLRQLEEARALAVSTSKTKNKVEDGMRNLTIMLESFKPLQEERVKLSPEEKKQKSQKQQENVNEQSQAVQLIGGNIKKQAFRAEQAMDDTINRIYENAQQNLKYAKEQKKYLQDGMETVYRVWKEPDVSEKDKDEAIEQYLKDGRTSLGIMEKELGAGLARMQNIRDIRRERRDCRNMSYAKQAQDAVSDIADHAALDEWYQTETDRLESDTIEELAARIRELMKEEQMANAETGQHVEESAVTLELQEKDAVKMSPSEETKAAEEEVLDKEIM